MNSEALDAQSLSLSIRFRFSKKIANIGFKNGSDWLGVVIKPVSVCKRVRPDKICGRLSTKDGNGKSEGARDERSIEAEPLRNEIETERNSASAEPKIRVYHLMI